MLFSWSILSGGKIFHCASNGGFFMLFENAIPSTIYFRLEDGLAKRLDLQNDHHIGRSNGCKILKMVKVRLIDFKIFWNIPSCYLIV